MQRTHFFIDSYVTDSTATGASPYQAVGTEHVDAVDMAAAIVSLDYCLNAVLLGHAPDGGKFMGFTATGSEPMVTDLGPCIKIELRAEWHVTRTERLNPRKVRTWTEVYTLTTTSYIYAQ